MPIAGVVPLADRGRRLRTRPAAGNALARPLARHLQPRRLPQPIGPTEAHSAGLTPRLLEVLKAVAAADGLSQNSIMAATGIDRSSANPCNFDIVRGRRAIDLHTGTTARRISVGGTQI
jgi:hypothetical protein